MNFLRWNALFLIAKVFWKEKPGNYSKKKQSWKEADSCCAQKATLLQVWFMMKKMQIHFQMNFLLKDQQHPHLHYHQLINQIPVGQILIKRKKAIQPRVSNQFNTINCKCIHIMCILTWTKEKSLIIWNKKERASCLSTRVLLLHQLKIGSNRWLSMLVYRKELNQAKNVQRFTHGFTKMA